jgi:ribosome recycling factor
MEEIEFILDSAKEKMNGAIKHLEVAFSKIRAGLYDTRFMGCSIKNY